MVLEIIHYYILLVYANYRLVSHLLADKDHNKVILGCAISEINCRLLANEKTDSIKVQCIILIWITYMYQ